MNFEIYSFFVQVSKSTLYTIILKIINFDQWEVFNTNTYKYLKQISEIFLAYKYAHCKIQTFNLYNSIPYYHQMLNK